MSNRWLREHIWLLLKLISAQQAYATALTPMSQAVYFFYLTKITIQDAKGTRSFSACKKLISIASGFVKRLMKTNKNDWLVITVNI